MYTFFLATLLMELKGLIISSCISLVSHSGCFKLNEFFVQIDIYKHSWNFNVLTIQSLLYVFTLTGMVDDRPIKVMLDKTWCSVHEPFKNLNKQSQSQLQFETIPKTYNTQGFSKPMSSSPFLNYPFELKQFIWNWWNHVKKPQMYKSIDKSISGRKHKYILVTWFLGSKECNRRVKTAALVWLRQFVDSN